MRRCPYLADEVDLAGGACAHQPRCTQMRTHEPGMLTSLAVAPTSSSTRSPCALSAWRRTPGNSAAVAVRRGKVSALPNSETPRAVATATQRLPHLSAAGACTPRSKAQAYGSERNGVEDRRLKGRRAEPAADTPRPPRSVDDDSPRRRSRLPTDHSPRSGAMPVRVGTGCCSQVRRDTGLVGVGSRLIAPQNCRGLLPSRRLRQQADSPSRQSRHAAASHRAPTRKIADRARRSFARSWTW